MQMRMMSRSSSPNQEERPAQALLAAAAKGDITRMRELLEAAPSAAAVAELVQAEGEWGRTPLMISCYAGHVGCVELLLRTHDPAAQVAATSGYGSTALIFACTGGHPECARLLLRHGPDAQVAASNQFGQSALWWAAHHGRLECLVLLLAHSPQLQQLDEGLVQAASGWAEQQRMPINSWGMSAPRRREARPYRRCVELLLSKGAMLTPRSPEVHFELVRPVVCDLAALAAVPDTVHEAAARHHPAAALAVAGH